MNDETMLLLERYFDAAFAAPDGVQKLRELILTLAMQGKLVPQDPNDQPASELLKAIELEKKKLVKEGKIKQPKPFSDIKPEEVPYDLPKNWMWVRLGELGETQTGTTPPTKNNENYGNYIPFVGPGDIKNHIIDYSRNGLSEIGISKARFIEKNSILMVCIGGSIGKHAINDRDITCNQQINTITPYRRDSVKYLFFSMGMHFFQKVVISQAGGSATPIINKLKWASIPIPLPPLAEQRWIVAKIEQLMARCDELEKLRRDRAQKLITVHSAAIDRLLTAQSNHDFTTAWQFIAQHFNPLYSVKETVAELRKTILQLAVMGKLVPQDPNDEPALVLANTIRLKRSETKEKSKKDSPSKTSDLPVNIPFQAPPSWTWQRVTDIYEVAGGIQKTPQRTPVSNFFPYLRVANVQRGRLDLSQIEYFELFDDELDKRKLKSGDLLVVEGNGSDKEIGRCAIWNGEIENCVHQNHIIRMRPIGHDGQLFTLLFLNSSCGMAEMKNLAITTSGLYSLSVGKIREILIPLPPLAEQHRIVAKVDQLMALCDRLEQTIAAAQTKQTQLLNAVIAQI